MISYKPFEFHYLDQVLVLLEPLWGHLSLEERKAYFEWKYINAKHLTINDVFIAVNEKDKVVAFRGYFNLTHTLSNNKIKVLSFSDATVRNDYKNKGIFKALTNYSLNSLSSKNLIYTTTSNNTWRTSISYINMGSKPLADKAVKYGINPLFYFKKKNYLKIEISTEFNTTLFTTFYNSFITPQKILIDNDATLWKWRFSNPITNYKFLYIWEKDILVGFLAYYKINKHRAYILDYYFTNNNYLASCLYKMFKEDGIKITQLWSISKSSDKTIQSMFFSIDFLLKILKRDKIPPVLVRPGNHILSDEDWSIKNINLSDFNNWNLNLICSDGI